MAIRPYLTHSPHPKFFPQKGRGTLRFDRIISEQAVSLDAINIV